MKIKQILLLVTLSFCASSMLAQFGVKAGVNIANEINTFNQVNNNPGFVSSNLTGYQIGLVYQAMPKKTGLGFEIAALLSQKGSTFSDTSNVVGTIKQGYKELNYLEFPLNLRYCLSLGVIGIYGFGGVYGGYLLSGKIVDETSSTLQTETISSLSEHLDYGYNVGAGVELFKKIQFGATWSQGLKDTSNSNVGLPSPTKSLNRVLSVNLVYLF